jgi:DNA-directed RNA polymerase specialized sigma24 family protein
MDLEDEKSVSRWIEGAKRGDSEALKNLWRRYFDRLRDFARRRLGSVPRRAADEEDVALSGFAEFCRAAEQGRLAELSHREELWPLLISITARKAIDRVRHEQRSKRGGGAVRGESALAYVDGASGGEGLAGIADDCPTPDVAAMVAEECTRLLDRLDDDLRPVALAKMDDCTNQEIAAKLLCSVSTVERSLRLIRKIWQKEADR